MMEELKNHSDVEEKWQTFHNAPLFKSNQEGFLSGRALFKPFSLFVEGYGVNKEF